MFTIIGTASSKVVAQEQIGDSRKAEQVADYWRSSGLEVATAIETNQPQEAKSGRVPSQGNSPASILGHPGEPFAGYFTPRGWKSQ